ncbi:YheV family putative zinc ribbon protein [Microbulbifer litoralis]|uniref:YheV family putative zinc ribbon protein n=1 Tax=Microbulbifer litoralis TaxID=2933965 RepID=UPI002027C41F|nr:YheV family putative zinc ribbon protein [Microbulbifer sp. GX H0434]
MTDEQHRPTARKPKKRFIAGAVCPRCSEMDKIVNYREGDKNYRECVACGFRDEIRLQSSPRELQTRVNTSGGAEEVETPVKIIQPNKKQ